MKIIEKDGFYIIQLRNCERLFFTAWQAIAFLSNINLETQKN